MADDLKAQRAEFEAWANSAAIRMDLGAWDAWQAARRAAPSSPVADDRLPPLPEPCKAVLPLGWIRYTAEQVRQAQREAAVWALARYCGADAGGTQLITRLMTEVNDLRSLHAAMITKKESR